MVNKLDFISPEFKKKIKEVVSHLDRSIDALYNLATKDEKTSLYNHLFFKNVLGIELEKARRGKPLSLVMIDIDFFKKVNDNCGHLTGDRILFSLAKLLKKSLRKSDIIARFGGEEFFIMLPNTPLDKATKIAERLRKSVENTNFKPKITISLGVAEYKKGDNQKKLIERVDSALYKSKQSGRNKVSSQ